MKFDFSILAKSVPAILIVCGFIGVFILASASAWILVFLGVGLQVLYLMTRNR